MALHAAGALHARTQFCRRHADRQGHSGRTGDRPRRTRMHSDCACCRASAHTTCSNTQLRARRLRVRACAAAGTRTRMLQAACGPARPCVAPRHGRAGRRADARRPPQKQRTRWQLVPPRSARARRRRRRARPPRREAAACPLPVVAPMVRNLAEIVPKGPRAPGPATAKFVRPSPGRGPESTTVPKRVSGDGQKCLKKCRGRPPGQLDLGPPRRGKGVKRSKKAVFGTTPKRKRSKKE